LKDKSDYTNERDALFADLTLDNIMTELKLEWPQGNNEVQGSAD
jgi:hypothetical protein